MVFKGEVDKVVNFYIVTLKTMWCSRGGIDWVVSFNTVTLKLHGVQGGLINQDVSLQ